MTYILMTCQTCQKQERERSAMKRKLKFLFIAVIVCILVLFVKVSVFQTRNIIDIPLLFLFGIIALLVFMWFDYLKKKDDDRGFM